MDLFRTLDDCFTLMTLGCLDTLFGRYWQASIPGMDDIQVLPTPQGTHVLSWPALAQEP